MLSHHGLKIFDQAEGMVQLTKDKTAIHIAVREKVGVEQDAGMQLREMKALVLAELEERSVGTRVRVSYLSPEALMKSHNLVDGVNSYTEEEVDRAERSDSPLVAKRRLVPETVSSVKGCLMTSGQSECVFCSLFQSILLLLI